MSASTPSGGASGGGGGKMKLKLNTTQANNSSIESPRPSATPVQTPGSGLKLSFKKSVPPTPSATSPPPPKPSAQRKNSTAKSATSSTPASKKRSRQDNDADGSQTGSAKKQPKLNGTPGSAAKKNKSGGASGGAKAARQNSTIKLPLARKGSIIKLKASSRSQPSTPTGQTRLKIKAKGKPPPRPPGVGYDSEAEDAEQDPAIEENFVLRMLPGPDCDYLRKAIEERKVGLPVSQGGADVSFRFFSRDGRRAAINIQGRHYAAVLVDLPCIVESMKSWDRKGWWKSADVCQMLLVLGKVNKEEDAKDFAVPKELDTTTWQWPHGLTPPMHNVRKRRFRKRVSRKTIEAAEEEVERLLQDDDQAVAQKGKTSYEVIDPDAKSASEEAEDERDRENEDVEMDGYGFDEEAVDGEDFDVGDHEAMAARMELELGAGAEEDDDDEDDEDILASSAPASGAEGQMMEKSVDSPAAVEDSNAPSAAATPAAEVPSDAIDSADTGGEQEEDSDDDEDDDEEEDDDDDDEDEEEEVDDDARERAQYLAQQREEIAHLEHELANQQELLKGMQNPILRQRITAKIKSIEGDLDVKRRALGEGDED